MIKLGDKNIKQFYLGDKPLSKIYKGDQLVWQKEVIESYLISGKFTDDSTETYWCFMGGVGIYLDVDPETMEFEYNTTDDQNLTFNSNKYLEHIYSFPLVLVAESCFYGCKKLKTVKLNNSNLQKQKSLKNLFYNCWLLETCDLSEIDTSNVTTMQDMFYYCSGLRSLNVSNFNTSNVTDMSYMFYGCEVLTSLDVTNFDTSKVTTMGAMFAGCSQLISLDLSNFNLSGVTIMLGMFQNCLQLRNLKLNNFGCNENVNVSNMFKGCDNLGLDEEGETVNRQSLVDTLLTNSFDRAEAGYEKLSVEIPTYVLNRLTDEEKAQITSKGFTLVQY